MMFKTEATNIRQSCKAFNRMKSDGNPRDRVRDIHATGVRRFGRKYGRVQPPEMIYAELIREGIVRVTRRRGKYPFVEVKWKDEWVDLATFQMTEAEAAQAETLLSPDSREPIPV